MLDKEIRTAFFPNQWRDNPYLDLLEASLRDFGVSVDSTKVDRPFRWWLKKNHRLIDVLHFHWLNYIYQRETYLASLIAVLKFGIQLRYAKHLRYKLIWTMHNAYPHERIYPRNDKLVRRLILRYADAVIVHCKQAKLELEKNFGGHQSIYIAPHGSYIGVYPDIVTQDESRNQLGITKDCFIFLHHGSLRSYKGLEKLIKLFHSISNPNFVLLIAGKVHDHYIDQGDYLKQVVAEDPRIITYLDWIPDNDLQLYYRAADVVVCPFDNILTSGSVILGMTFGRPVIAPALGCLPELISQEVGILYNPVSKDGLREALIDCEFMDLRLMGENAYKVAESLTWHDTANITRSAYLSQSLN